MKNGLDIWKSYSSKREVFIEKLLSSKKYRNLDAYGIDEKRYATKISNFIVSDVTNSDEILNGVADVVVSTNVSQWIKKK